MPIAKLVCSLWLSQCALAYSATDPELSARLDAAILKVMTVNADGSTSVGSSVAIAPSRFVTNCHVIRNARRIEVTRGAERWRAELRGQDAEHDVCVLAAAAPACVPLLGTAKHLTPGKTVFAAGYPGGERFIISEGEIKALHEFEGSRVIQTSAPFSPGASGGGLFDSEGHLIGILTFKSVSGGEYHFALPTDWLARVLSEAEGKKAPAKINGKAFWEQAGARQPYFLRAATLEIDHNWKALLDISRKWLQMEAGNPQPWIAVGIAHSHMNRPHDAAAAFRKAAVLDPTYAPALSRFKEFVHHFDHAIGCDRYAWC